MEVLRHGNTYKEVECKECGALLSYCNSDLKKSIISQEYYHGEWCESYNIYIDCPECNSRITILHVDE